MSTKRIVAMATFPPRRLGLLQVVRDILPQCDVLHVYANGYDERPEGLPDDPKLDVRLAGPKTGNPDLQSYGKFFWCDHELGYYMTVDDDIFYPPDYVDYLVNGVEKYGRKAIVGVHGGVYRVRANGPLPTNGYASNHRTLYTYDKAIPQDMPCHILGAGCMACYPSDIGLRFEIFEKSAIHSGDDETIALFAQERSIPLVRLVGRNNWVRPNNAQWQINPLHHRKQYMDAADQKLKRWGCWRLHMPPKPQPVPKPQPAMTTPTLIPNGPCFDKVLLSNEDYAFTDKIMSSDALAAQLITRIKRKVPTSVIRMSDGERAIIEYSRNAPAASFLQDPGWLKRYGLEGANLKQVGQDLLWAGKEASYLACTISGVFWDIFKVHPLFPDRQRFIDQFWPNLMMTTDRVGPLLRAAPVLVLHREHEKLVPTLRNKFGQPNIDGRMLNSWRDHEAMLREVPRHPAQIVLVSGGASGKPLCVKLAKACDKTILDVGEALGGVWCK